MSTLTEIVANNKFLIDKFFPLQLDTSVNLKAEIIHITSYE